MQRVAAHLPSAVLSAIFVRIYVDGSVGLREKKNNACTKSCCSLDRARTHKVGIGTLNGAFSLCASAAWRTGMEIQRGKELDCEINGADLLDFAQKELYTTPPFSWRRGF